MRQTASGRASFSACSCCQPGFIAADVDNRRRSFLADDIGSIEQEIALKLIPRLKQI